MRTFSLTAYFQPTRSFQALVEPYNETVVDPFGFLALEGGAGLLLQEDMSSRILLEASVISLTADSTIRTADRTTNTADQTFEVITS